MRRFSPESLNRPNFVPSHNGPRPAGGLGRTRRRAFTLIELLVVVAIMTVITALIVPAFTGINAGRNVAAAAYDIAGTLEEARAYAMANNTYTWVGIYEENAAQSSQTPAVSGTGRVILSIVASANGIRYSDASVTGTSPMMFKTTGQDSSNLVTLVQVNKLLKISNVHIGALNTGTTPALNRPIRPAVSINYQVGDPTFGQHGQIPSGTLVSNTTVFTYPLTPSSGGPQYTFQKVIEFNPQGAASKIVDNIPNGPQEWLEIAIQPSRGAALDALYRPGAANATAAAAAVLIEGSTGRIRIFQL